MAVLTHSVKMYTLRISFIHKFDQVVEKLVPRPCMLISAGLALTGVSIPILMAASFLSLSLGLCFLSILLVATGSGLALILCGEL
jgi:hypothetical protein